MRGFKWYGGICVIYVIGTMASNGIQASDVHIASVPSSIAPSNDARGMATDKATGKSYYLELDYLGRLKVRSLTNEQLASGTSINGEIVWFIGK